MRDNLITEKLPSERLIGSGGSFAARSSGHGAEEEMHNFCLKRLVRSEIAFLTEQG